MNPENHNHDAAILPDQDGHLSVGRHSEGEYVEEAGCVSVASCVEWGSEADYGCGLFASSAPLEIYPDVCSDHHPCRRSVTDVEEICRARSYRCLLAVSDLSPSVGF